MSISAKELGRELRGGKMSRRMFIGAVIALAAGPRAFAKKSSEPVRAASLNHSVLSVSDPERSIEWFQGLFGMPKVAEYKDSTILRVGNGPQFLSILNKTSDKTGIVHFGIAVEGFDPDELCAATIVMEGTKEEVAYQEKVIFPLAGKFGGISGGEGQQGAGVVGAVFYGC